MKFAPLGLPLHNKQDGNFLPNEKTKKKGRKERKEVASEMFQCICSTGNAECPGNDFTCNKGKEVQSVCFTFQKVILENDKR